MGIVVCGLNGSGKTTLGRALAAALGKHFIDSEQLFFPDSGPDRPYAAPRSREEAEARLLADMQAHSGFVFATVKGTCGPAVTSFFRRIVLIQVPKEVRMERIRQRSFGRFGRRMLPGGDLFDQEAAFFAMAENRREDEVEGWAARMDCPVLRVDGLLPPEENIARVAGWLRQLE